MISAILAAAPMVSHAVLAEEKEILRSEGYFHVRGIYLANAADADRLRRLEAERRVEERESIARIARDRARCDEPIGD